MCAFAVSRDGSSLAAVSANGTLRHHALAVAGGDSPAVSTSLRHTVGRCHGAAAVTCAAYHPLRDGLGRYLATGAAYGGVRVRDLGPGVGYATHSFWGRGLAGGGEGEGAGRGVCAVWTGATRTSAGRGWGVRRR